MQAGAERALVEQIAGRLTVAAPGTTLYQGTKAYSRGWWRWRPKSISRSISTRSTRCSATRSSWPQASSTSRSRSGSNWERRFIASRFAGALVRPPTRRPPKSLRWKRFDPGQPEDAAWKLSLLSQLNSARWMRAILSGGLSAEVPAPEPRIVGAEALVRSTHPEKGAIGPIGVDPAAEQSRRFEKLTELVLDPAIRADEALIDGGGIEFTMSVNISPSCSAISLSNRW